MSRRRGRGYSGGGWRGEWSGGWNGGWAPYIPVAERRAKAARQMEKQRKKGETFEPVTCEGRLIARTFWGKAWGDHLESHSDFSNRLPRGRTYLRNGSVCDLKIRPGKVIARVIGSELYTVEINIKKLPETRWAAIRKSCAGGVASVIELLQGRLSSGVMTIITDRTEGLFPRPAEIEMECSCPDYAAMCKHVAATLYGVGARLDSRPELLFVLRGVDHLELIGAAVGEGLAAKAAESSEGIALTEAELSDVFGIDIAAGTEGPKSKEATKAGKRKASEKAARITRPGVKEPPRIEGIPKTQEKEKKKGAQLLKINMAAEKKTKKGTPKADSAKRDKDVKPPATEEHDRRATRMKTKLKKSKPTRLKKASG